jgi:2-polyprenyl-3-methyl-5-hydroxy-6-metoxy-1,4-benzoquinol methylase
MGEVLEHVEQPELFLRRIAELAADDAFIFITTCINAPAVDHIYLWRTTDELEDMIRDSGLSIVEPLRLPYEGKTLEESRDQQLPINVAYVLSAAPTGASA